MLLKERASWVTPLFRPTTTPARIHSNPCVEICKAIAKYHFALEKNQRNKDLI